MDAREHPAQPLRPVRGEEAHSLRPARLDVAGECLRECLRAQDRGLALVEHTEAWVEAGLERMRAQQAVAEAVDRRDPAAVEVACEIVALRLHEPLRIRVRSSPAARSVYVMTRTLSMPSPRSQTAFTNRSTSSVVLPVPAPAETKTTPGSSIAATCWSEGVVLARVPDPAHRPEGAPARALSSPRIGANVTRVHPVDRAPGRGLRLVDLVPEVVLGDVSGQLQPGHRVLARVGADEAAGLPRPSEPTVDSAERLHADEIAKREDVERDLELLLGLDIAGAVRPAELVVLDDAAVR